MINFFGALKSLLKLDSVSIDDNVFRLHYKVTMVILVAFSMVITAKQYVGDPINCMVKGIPSHIMDSYCWIYSTFTLPGATSANSAHPGVSTNVEGDEIKHHMYYQWVCFVLFFQAVCFYVPRHLWKSWEGGRVKMLSVSLSVPISNEDRTERVHELTRYFIKNLNTHNFYIIYYVMCECLNLVNVLAQIVFLDYFLDGEFRTYGADVLMFSEMLPENRIDPMARVFPKVTKCTFQNYGPSGTVQSIDGLCVLPLNIVNEKIFVFIWFWFLIVAAVSAVNLLYRVLVIVVPHLRVFLMKSNSRLTTRSIVQIVVNKCQIGTWFVLFQLGKNIDPTIFKELLTELADRLIDEEHYETLL